MALPSSVRNGISKTGFATLSASVNQDARRRTEMVKMGKEKTKIYPEHTGYFLKVGDRKEVKHETREKAERGLKARKEQLIQALKDLDNATIEERTVPEKTIKYFPMYF
jgi:hypothetical protein